ncbi:DUF5008 domain-containing protein [Sphingobacterium bovistauri]|uniref:DUF5008 domain-containing protein n=1 Tax=Sphingobacterium bovistauri TaxID=2781959 RepID=A0ABS7Z6U9_9SPHI|nr:DUF5008 domain-containing protein [Sphingobacterium bovistauri]MCA5005911.1 DUF5008 domain-containing protein [Sphingobacterium bovistauri]
MRYKLFKIYSILLGLILLVSCGKDREVGINPYDGGESPLGIKFLNINRKIDAVRPLKDVLQLQVKGLLGQKEDISAFINEQKAEIIAFTDTTLDIRVPEFVSSGIVKILVGNQVFYGPRVPIEGKVKVDTDFSTGEGFNGPINQLLQVGGNYFVVGGFSNYKTESIADKVFRNGIHAINNTGNTIDSKFGRGTQGSIYSIAQLSDGKFLIGGSFSTFDKKQTNGMTRLQSNGALDTTIVDVLNSDISKPERGKDTVSIFPGNIFGSVYGIYPSTDEKTMLIVGNFNYYGKPNYKVSTYKSQLYTYTEVRNVARLKIDGSLDSTFQIKNTGVNGIISKSVRLSNGKIIIVGGFTKYNGMDVNNFLVLNADGSLDAASTGAGGNGTIYDVSYNAVSKKIALVGKFTMFKGANKKYAVVLNDDFTVDQKFTLGDTEGKIPVSTYAMNNGKIVVCGDIVKYNSINRSGLLILESTGEALQDYNNLSAFVGSINTVVETKSSEGYPALLMGGYFISMDGNRVGSIMRLEIRD